MLSKLKTLSPSVPFVTVMLAFLCWSAIFIYRSSVPLDAGGRVFCLFDDAMVSMRYAENLANGNGPVWNVGVAVEGYTNPLMVIVMAMLLVVFSKPMAVLFVQILGTLVVLFTALLSVGIYKRIADRKTQLPNYLVLTFLLTIYTLSYWSIMGMETGFVALFLTLGVFTVISDNDLCGRLSFRHIVLLTLSGAGLYLSRPDALFFVIILLAFVTLTTRKREEFKSVIVVGSIIGGIVALHLIFRLSYYGTTLPNTALLKLGHFPLQYRVFGGIGFILPFLAHIYPLAILAIFGTMMKRNHSRYLMLSLFAISIGYQIYVGGDPWSYWRIMSPTMPLLVVLAMDGALRLSLRILGPSTRYFVLLVSSTCLMLLAVWHYNKPFMREFMLLDNPYTSESNVRNVNIAYAIRELTRESASVGVFWAGSIPFYSERYAFDFLGKSDPLIAALLPDLSGRISWNGMDSVPGHNKYDLTISIINRKPTYIQDDSWGSDDVSVWARKHYISVRYRGSTMLFLKDSPDVHWEKIEDIANKDILVEGGIKSQK